MTTEIGSTAVADEVSTEAKAVKVKKKKVVDLVAEEAKLIEKYPNVIAGTLKFNTEGPHKNKRTVMIRCATPGCENTREVATSDLHQVKYCEECSESMARSKRNERAKMRRTEARQFRALQAADSDSTNAGEAEVAGVEAEQV